MKICHLLLPSGITEGIPLLVEAHWTSEQALAVVALLDDLRKQIVRHYMLQIQLLPRRRRRALRRPSGRRSRDRQRTVLTESRWRGREIRPA